MASNSKKRLCRTCEEPASLRCSGCKKVWYCSRRCQEELWPCHIFDCNPNCPIRTVYHLARAVRRDLLPEDPQTCLDWGFTRAVSRDRKTMLFGLYVGLLGVQRVKPTTLDQWRLHGTLIEEIKRSFNRIPANHYRGEYYPWFLQNQDVVLGGEADPVDERNYTYTRIKDTWEFIGRPVEPQVDHSIILSLQDTLPRDERDCFGLYSLILFGEYPRPHNHAWVLFGFCTCKDQSEQEELRKYYYHLIESCTFTDFCAAYSSSSLYSMFDSRDVWFLTDIVRDWGLKLSSVLQETPRSHKSVWYLKQYVTLDEAMDVERFVPKYFKVDYGFANCETEEDIQRLKDVYRNMLFATDADPLMLHKAAMAGYLLEYVSKRATIALEPREHYARLLTNPYTESVSATPGSHGVC
jgi:hypothetical protein